MPLSRESNKDNYLSTLIMLSSGLLNMLNVLKWFPYYFGDYHQQQLLYCKRTNETKFPNLKSAWSRVAAICF